MLGSEDTSTNVQAETNAECCNQDKSPDLAWYASPDGALVCFNGSKNLVALPEGDKRIPPTQHGEPRCIEGKNYLIFEADHIVM